MIIIKASTSLDQPVAHFKKPFAGVRYNNILDLN